MISGILVGLAVLMWCRPSPVGRCRRVLLPSPRGRSVPSPTRIAQCCVLIAAVLYLGPATGLLVGGVLTLVVPRLVRQFESGAARARARAIERQLPVAIDLLAAVVEAGQSADGAVRVVAAATPEPLGEDLAMVSGRLAVAADPLVVWTSLDGRLAGLGRAFARAHRAGIPAADVLSRAAVEAREERLAGAQQQARSIGVRSTAPLGACFLPAFFLVGVAPTVIGAIGQLIP